MFLECAEVDDWVVAVVFVVFAPDLWVGDVLAEFRAVAAAEFDSAFVGFLREAAERHSAVAEACFKGDVASTEADEFVFFASWAVDIDYAAVVVELFKGFTCDCGSRAKSSVSKEEFKSVLLYHSVCGSGGTANQEE